MSNILSRNKKAYFNYEILEEFEAGIVLLGQEVKSARLGQINLQDAHVKIDGGEAWLWNADIAKYKFSTDDKYDPLRSRKLLLSKDQIYQISGKVKQSRLTLVALKAYIVRNRVKVIIGLARGKKQHDKKEKIKARDLDRDLHRDKRQFMVK